MLEHFLHSNELPDKELCSEVYEGIFRLLKVHHGMQAVTMSVTPQGTSVCLLTLYLTSGLAQ
jgi:hypothetical protein